MVEIPQLQEVFNALGDGSILVNGQSYTDWQESISQPVADETESINIQLSMNPGILSEFDQRIQDLKQAQLQIATASHEDVTGAFNALNDSAEALCKLTAELHGNTTNLVYEG